MRLGIKPTVDFAFKKIFGSPQNSAALIGLLNAILDLDRPIVAVEILNPFSYQEFAESKLIVLDVRCRDSEGRWRNVEMQVSVYAGLSFQMQDRASGRKLDNAIEVHTVELTKYNLNEEAICEGGKLEQWAIFERHRKSKNQRHNSSSSLKSPSR